MATLSHLIAEYGAYAYVLADAGNGSAHGEDGRLFSYDDEAAGAYGDLELAPLDTPAIRADGTACHFASEWIVSGAGPNPYRYRVMF